MSTILSKLTGWIKPTKRPHPKGRNDESDNVNQEQSNAYENENHEEGANTNRNCWEFLDVRHLDAPNQPRDRKFPKRYPKNDKSVCGRSFQKHWFLYI